MNKNDFDKLLKIRKLLKEAYDHYFEHSDGHCKSGEGHISIEYGDYWSDSNCKLSVTGISICSYVLGPNRSHFFDTIDEALKTVIAWHKNELSTIYDEYGEPDNTHYLINPKLDEK